MIIQLTRSNNCSILQIGGRKVKSSIATDNGRAPEFIRRRDYPDKSACYECGEEGHLSYQCEKNTLGNRTPPPKKVRVRGKNKRKSGEMDTSYFDSDSDDGCRQPRGDPRGNSEGDVWDADDNLSSAIREEVRNWYNCTV